MKRIAYVFITFLCIIIANRNAYADSLEEALKPYKNEANKITTSYQYNENYIDESGNKKNGMFILKIGGITENLKIKLDDNEKIYYYKDTNNGELIIDSVESGIKKIHVYSVKYPSFLKTITVNIPKYNYYSDRAECDDITNLDVCDKWYKYELNETTFLKKINEYKKAQEEIKKSEEKTSNTQIIFNKIINFLKKYFFYIIVIIIIVPGIIIYIKIRKKRNSLE